MTEYEFELIVEGVDLAQEEVVTRLYDAGLSDATISSRGGQVTLSVAREAPTFVEAVLSAIRQAESVAGVRVVRVAPDELVNAADIAHRTGRTRSSITMLMSGQRGQGGFPPPAVHHSGGSPLWRWSEVDAWFARREGRSVDRHRTALIATVNAVLEARRAQGELAVKERRQVADLLAS